jgi:hypothetical protein
VAVLLGIVVTGGVIVLLGSSGCALLLVVFAYIGRRQSGE